MSAVARPLGGPIFTRVVRVIALIFAIGAAMILWRLVAGLGATTALSDGQPWGLWIAFDVVTGTALACGGYAVAILVYVLNKGRYHPMVRPALLSSALGYTMAGVSVALDVGKPWTIWKIPVYFWSWNLNSALLEVALCIMAYMFVLWIELSPAFLERFQEGPEGGLKRFAQKTYPIIQKALVWIIALGMLLPTMHQSSLGTLLVLSGPKLHPLWQTPWLPFLFLVSCISMGYAIVVAEPVMSVFFGHREEAETGMLAGLSRAMLPLLAVFVLFRFGDLAYRGNLGLAFQANRFAIAFWIEMALFVLPFFMLASARQRADLGNLFRAAMAMLLGGALYRFDTFLLAYRYADDVRYFPSVPELLITLGLIAGEILIYVIVVKRFPIIGGSRERAIAQA
jgi:Ni/Fe-hydrogenase subunit HybB-like protein